LPLQPGGFQSLALVGKDLDELDKSVAHGEDQGALLLDVRLARASTTGDGLEHNDAVPRVDEPLVGLAKVLPGIAYVSYRSHAGIALIHVRVENAARRVHPDVWRAQLEQASCRLAALVRLAEELEALAHDFQVLLRHTIIPGRTGCGSGD